MSNENELSKTGCFGLSKAAIYLANSDRITVLYLQLVLNVCYHAQHKHVIAAVLNKIKTISQYIFNSNLMGCPICELIRIDKGYLARWADN